VNKENSEAHSKLALGK